MSNANKRRAETEAVLAEIRARQKAKQRKWNILVYGGFGLLLAAIITAVAVVVTGALQEKNAVAEAAKKPIDGVQTYSGLSSNHVQTPVSYPQKPGVGGDHAAVWANCGVYTQPVSEERAVHSLEHGAVWLSYKPDLPAAEVNQLTALAKANPYILLSPDTNQSEPVTATAWGAQLAVQNAGDSRIPTFVSAYAQSTKAPEPGASCTGGSNG
ncbi:DUF3105 domain-containing protein (plasmid) [Arthrobacter sp. TES]|uniref:DUF3105 domain-containing protein n=1 Tax=Paenarthrobacter ureafaciens TaxID=37931 RepID=UPI000395F44E|nr:DUF3105 domain-containing protein [Paenarthrobacter ureafaciens]AOY74164.1 hypothetical protein ARZXY2_4665 [Arthrobacter sp. ZXY-2]ERI38026.1 hypothetical protein M707_08210 [Arthrobacter sp. AK-YN10]QOI65767.1 DUF3105 domain-containing protein [Arthrobacter sp. TES]GLU61113.1 membrane protein [Paenarthrobacter ureafaciens]GLU65382.1 membrane protein [Paenarthrobacter ureafaciens]